MGKWKKNLILKAWKRCRLSFGAGAGYNKMSQLKASNSSKSLSENNDHDDNKKGQIIALNGCFPVYVGPQKQRFVVKTEYANHPLFRMLLEEAELEYGFECDGPIWLPCNVDLFYKVLAEMDGQEDINNINPCRSFNKVKGYNSFLVLLSLARFLCSTNGGHGAYKVMDSEMLKINHFQY